MQHQQGNWVAILVPFAVIVIVMTLRLRSMGKERPLNLNYLWVVPVIYLAIASSMLLTLPPTPLGWGLALAGLGLGIGLGWHRGKLIRINRNPETGALTQKASPLAMLLLVALVALKLAARAMFGDVAPGHPAGAAMMLTDAFIGFALGLLSATRAELYLRGRRLLDAA